VFVLNLPPKHQPLTIWICLKAPTKTSTIDPVACPWSKTGRHDIAEILLKVALNTKNQINHHHQWLMFWWEI
jgi:hypothetical protein